MANTQQIFRSIAFIDSGVEAREKLVSGILEGVEVVKLESQRDGVTQISEFLAEYQGEVSTVHIVSHGSPGCLYLGNGELNLDNFNDYAEQLKQWFAAVGNVSPNLFIYGCKVAAGDAGEEFIGKIGALTGANIAASANLTGNAALGGDWELEVTLGEGEFVPAFASETLNTYSSVLDTGESSLSKIPSFVQTWLDKNNPVPNVSITQTANQITAIYNGTLDVTATINEILTKLNLKEITQQISATNPTLVVQGTPENPTGYEFSVSQIPVGQIMNGLEQLSNKANLFKGLSSTGNVDLILSDKGVKVTYPQAVQLDINDIINTSTVIDADNVVDTSNTNVFVQKAIENIENAFSDAATDATKIILKNSSLQVTNDVNTEIKIESVINDDKVTIQYRTPTNLSFSLPDFDGVDLSNILSKLLPNIPGIKLPKLASLDWSKFNFKGLDFEFSLLDGIPDFKFTLPNLPVVNLKSLFNGFGLSLPSLDAIFDLPNLPNLSLSIGTNLFQIEGLDLNFNDFLKNFGVDLPSLPDFNFNLPSLDIPFINGVPSIELPSLPVDFIKDLLPTIDADFKSLLNPIINEAKKFKVEPKKDEIKITYLENIDIASIVETVSKEAGLTIDLNKLTVKNPGLRIKKDEAGQRLYDVFIGEFSPEEAIKFLTGTVGIDSLPKIIQNQLGKVGNVSLFASKQGFGLNYLDNITLDINNLIDSDGFLKDAANTITEKLLGDGDKKAPGTQLVLTKPEVEFTKKDNNKELSFAGSFNGQKFDLDFDVNTDGVKIPKLSGFEFDLPTLNATNLENAFKSIAGTELPGFAKDLLITLASLANFNIELNDDGFAVTYLDSLDIKNIINSLSSTLGLGDNVLSKSLEVKNPGLRIAKDAAGNKIYEVSVGEFSPTQAVEFLTDTIGAKLPNSIQEQLDKVGKVGLRASNQGFGLTYLDNVIVNIDNLIPVDGLVKDAVNEITKAILGDGDDKAEGTQLVLAVPEVEFTKKQNAKELSFAGNFNGTEFKFGFDINTNFNSGSGSSSGSSSGSFTIPKLSGFEFNPPTLNATKLKNTLKSVFKISLPDFTTSFLDELASVANNLEFGFKNGGLQLTSLGDLDISSIIKKLTPSNFSLDSFKVKNPGLNITKDDNGKFQFGVSVGEFSPGQLIDLLVGLLPDSVPFPDDILTKIKELGNAGLSLSTEGISISYLKDFTLDLNSIIGDLGSIDLVYNAVKAVLGDADNNKNNGIQFALTTPQLEYDWTSKSLGFGGLFNDKEFDLSFGDGFKFNYDIGGLDLSTLIPGVSGFNLDKTELSFDDGFTFTGGFEFDEDSTGIPKFLNQIGLKSLEVDLDIGQSGASLSGNANTDITLFPILGTTFPKPLDDFKIVLNNLNLGLNLGATTSGTVGGSITLHGYDLIQEEEPPLQLAGQLELDPTAFTGKFEIDAQGGAWTNVFGIPDTEFRNITLQIGGTYAAPWLDNIGFIGDLKFGNYNFKSAVLVDSNNPNKFALELTLNEPLSWLDIFSGPVQSYAKNVALKQAENVDLGIIDKGIDLFKSFQDIVDISVVSIDDPYDEDTEIDPLIKVVPVDTKIFNTELEAGLGINAGVKVGDKEGTLNFNADIFSTNPSITGSLKIPEVSLKIPGINDPIIKISGVEDPVTGATDNDLNLNLIVSLTEQSYSGDGRIEILGREVSKANFKITPTAIEVKDFDFDLAVMKLDVNDFGVYLKPREIDGVSVIAQGEGNFQILNREIAKTDFQVTTSGFNIKDFDVDLGLLKLDVDQLAVNWEPKNASASGSAELNILGSKVGTAKIKGQGNQLKIEGDLDLFGLIEIEKAKIDVDGSDIKMTGALKFLGRQLADAKVVFKDDEFTVEGGLSLDLPFPLPDIYANLTITSDGTLAGSKVKLNSSVGSFEESLNNGINSIDDLAEIALNKLGGAEVGKVLNDLAVIGTKTLNDITDFTSDISNLTFTFLEGTWGFFGDVFNSAWNTISGLFGGGHDGDNDNNKIDAKGGHDEIYGFGGDDWLIAGSGEDTVKGGWGDDRIEGNNDPDLIYGEWGRDKLEGGGGNDTLYGDNNNRDKDSETSPENSKDHLIGGNESDHLYGGIGNDWLQGDGQDDQHSGNDHLYGQDGNDKLEGNRGNDRLEGGPGNDELHGGEDHDTLVGNEGDDLLHGDDGDDGLDGDDGRDILRGGSGNDRLHGGNDDDILEGEWGNDTLRGGSGSDKLQGGDGDDLLEGEWGNDLIYGNEGDDHLLGGDGEDWLEGGDGNDKLNGQGDNDFLFGHNGNDHLVGEAGDDLLHGDDGDDGLDGDDGRDILRGGSGNDRLHGGNDDDILEGEWGNDTLRGGSGQDLLRGGDGDDLLEGEWDNDILLGDRGNDEVYGGDGDDYVNGGSGDDTLKGGQGNDVLIGGSATFKTIFIKSNLDDSNSTADALKGDFNNLIVGDFDGDGDDDFIRQEKGSADDDDNWTTIFFRSNGDGTFSDQGVIDDSNSTADALKGDLNNLIVGDFDGDGDDDFIRQEKGSADDDDDWTAIFFRSNGDGTFSDQGVINDSNSTADALKGDLNNLIVGDFDGDGDDDFIRQEKGSADDDDNWTAIFFRSNGDGTFSDQGVIDDSNPDSDDFKGDLTNLIVGDFNGDGKDDFIRQEKGDWDDDDNNTANLFTSKGDGTFTKQGVIDDSNPTSDDFKGDLTNIIVGDFNGDGKDDFIRQEKGDLDDDDNNTANLFTSNGDGTFTKQGVIDDSNPNSDDFKGDFTNLIVGDFNGDGKDDFIRQEKGDWDDDDNNTANVFLSQDDDIEAGGNDLLEGGEGDDILNGGDGDDTLDPGTGNDTIDGGEGKDILVLTGTKSDYTFTETTTGWTITDNRDNTEKTVTGVEEFNYKLEGSAANGPLAGATAFIDTNGNFVLDEGESQTTTDNNGEYNFAINPETLDRNKDGTIDPQEAQIVVTGGIDTTTGLPGAIPLISPIGSTADYASTTPLTSIKAVLSSQGIAKEQVETLLTKISGLSLNSLSQSLDNFDPYAAIGEDKSSGINIASGHIKVMNLLLNGTEFLEAAGYKGADAQIQVIIALGEVLQTVDSFDLSKDNHLEKLFTQLTQKVNTDLNNEAVTAASELVAQSNNFIDDLVEQALSRSVSEVLPSINPIKKAVYSNLPEITQKLVKGEITPQQSQTQLQELLNADTFLVQYALNENRTVKVTASSKVTEGSNTKGQFIITLGEAAPAQGLKILYTLSGTATLGQDYNSNNGQFGEVQIKPGTTEAVIELEVLDDNLAEQPESVTINLRYVGDGFVLDPMYQSAVLDITDNDQQTSTNSQNGMTVTGTPGNDTLIGGAGDDNLKGINGNDFLDGFTGNDLLVGGAGDDTVQGGKGSDRLEGNFGKDLLQGDAGDDYLKGDSGNDTLEGNAGSDQLKGNTGDDQLQGNAGNDLLKGGLGNDILEGNEDNDWLIGEAGEDILIGGTGVDLLNGGEGADVFYFSTPNEGGDLILDFDPNQGDKIQISATGFNTDSLTDFSFLAGTLQYKGQEIALIQNNGQTYNNFGELSDIIEIVNEPTPQPKPEVAKVSLNLTPGVATPDLVEKPEITILDDIIQRGYVKVGTSSNGSKFDLEFARTLAAALFGDASKVKQISATSKEIFAGVEQGTIDIAAPGSSHTLERDAVFKIDFSPTYFYSDVESSKQPIALALRENDSQWADVVRWVNYVPVQAEEFGISSENIDQIIAANTDDNPNNDSAPEIRRFLGIEGELGATLGLPNDFAINIIKQVGNYGEIYQRHFPDVEREHNLVWNDGGQLYSPPFSGKSIETNLVDNDNRNLLQEVMQRGFLKLGLPGNNPGFAVQQENGELVGFDVDLGRAIAAAVFGDSNKLEIERQSFSDSFANTANGVVDVSAMGITHNLLRDASLGVDFSPTYLYTGQGILVKSDSGINVLPTLNGRKIGVLGGATALQNLEDAFSELGASFTPVEFSTNDELFAAYEQGEIDAVSTDLTILSARISTLSNPQKHRILDEVLSKEPLALITDENQSDWSDVVHWVYNALVQAEEYGITKANIDQFIAKNSDNNSENDSSLAIRQFLGLEGDIGKALGLPRDFVVKVIKAVGNYGEIYDRHFNSKVLRRDSNALASEFGLQYALPTGNVPEYTPPESPKSQELPTPIKRRLPNLQPQETPGIFTLENLAANLSFSLNSTNQFNEVVEIGIFSVDDKQGTVNGISPGTANYKKSVLSNSRVIFSMLPGANLPNGLSMTDMKRVLSLNENSHIGFYLLKGKSTHDVLNMESKGNSDYEILFSNSSQFQTEVQSDGSFLVNWSDGSNQIAFNVETQEQQTMSMGTQLQNELGLEVIDLSNESSPVALEVTVHREAAVDNIVILYKMEADGSVIDPVTGETIAATQENQSRYLRAALANRVEGLDISTGNQAQTILSSQLQAGEIYAPMMIFDPNNEVVDNLANPDTWSEEVQAYFLGTELNADGQDHVRLLGNNHFGFEDLYGGGDRDFNDLIIKFEMSYQ